MKNSNILIFTDLDGSLLDFDTYSFAGALKVLKKIKKRDIPLILTSSKTRFEIEKILKELKIDYPFIVENGAAIFFPKRFKKYLPKKCKKIDGYYVIILGKEYKKILKFKNKISVKGFSDFSVNKIEKLTNLDKNSAKLAKKREFSEPVIIKNHDITKIKNLAKKYGFKIIKGGRFYHIIGEGQDKSKAIDIVKRIYKKIYKNKILTIGIGDSKNDIGMLKSVDIPILIKKADGSYERINLKNLIKSKYPGSKGWGECVGLVLKREDIKSIFFASLDGVLPKNVIRKYVKIDKNFLCINDKKYDLKKYKNIYILGAGKASYDMAVEIEKILKDRIKNGVVISIKEKNLKNIKILKGSHPLPNKDSMKATKKMISLIKKIKKDDLVIFLLSGGASALMELPIPPITLKDLQTTNELLLRSGANIDEVNIVRKHISRVKGGRLAKMCKAEAAVLVISDVIGDSLEVIGSAPCYFDKTTFLDAQNILKKYDIYKKIPKSVVEVIKKGIQKKIDETLKEKNKKIKHFIIASNKIATKEGKKSANKLGYKAFLVTTRMCGEAKNVAKKIVKEAKKTEYKKDFVWIFGGETTVKVKGKGKGGRNQEMALSALKYIDSNENIVFLSAGTDGIDGNSKADGAIADHKIYELSKELGLNIEIFLENNDSYNFFKKVGNHIITGYTGTNVMDIAILIKERI